MYIRFSSISLMDFEMSIVLYLTDTLNVQFSLRYFHVIKNSHKKHFSYFIHKRAFNVAVFLPIKYSVCKVGRTLSIHN